MRHSCSKDILFVLVSTYKWLPFISCLRLWHESASMGKAKHIAVVFLVCAVNWSHQSVKETCKPASDLIFILDGGMYIDFPTAIIVDYNSHHIPDYAVRVGVVLCEEGYVHYLPLQAGMNDVADKFRNLQNIYHQNSVNINKADTAKQLSSLAFLLQTNETCLVLARAMFQHPERDDVSKMAMFVTNGELWNMTTNVEDVEGLKEDNITVVTVAVDVQDIDTLNDLMTIASDEGTCFVVKDSNSLGILAADFSRGTCQPITLQLKYPEKSVEKTTVVPETKNNSSGVCNRRKTGNNSYAELLHIPGFGLLGDKEVRCPKNKHFDQEKCDCVKN